MDIFSTVASFMNLQSSSFSKNLFKQRADLSWTVDLSLSESNLIILLQLIFASWLHAKFNTNLFTIVSIEFPSVFRTFYSH